MINFAGSDRATAAGRKSLSERVVTEDSVRVVGKGIQAKDRCAIAAVRNCRNGLAREWILKDSSRARSKGAALTDRRYSKCFFAV